ncbi:MAG: ABC transporter ATP-binding protein [Actinobacteria bacterium]|nr:ABC transporter ATP-binding protein [Actinomycetota bacterium]
MTGVTAETRVASAEVVVRIDEVSKFFPGVVANDKVSIDLRRGEIHALLGENGAGKTTIMNVLYGLYEPDAGSLEVQGQQVRIASPKAALHLGIGMVHQHFMLIPKFSIVENVVLGHEPTTKTGALDLTEARSRLMDLSQKFGLTVDPDRLVEDTSVGMQQRTEILKTLYLGASILILDEPTAVLAPQEVGDLFATIRSLTEGGLSIFFISHKLEEVMEISDRVTVIRGGRVVDTVDTAATTKEELAKLMVGREVVLQVDKEAQESGAPVLSVEGLCVKDHRGLMALNGVSFEVRAGEILGIAGVDGNGQIELEEAIIGLHRPSAGRLLLDGEDITRRAVKSRIEKGIGLVPQDRHKRGLILDFDLTENVLLGNQWRSPFTKPLGLDREYIRRYTIDGVREFAVKTPSVDSAASTLSGGNQQKLILARELRRGPRVLVASQPTRGLDVGAIEFVHRQLLAFRAKGVGILLISYELEEVLSLSDRILVLYEGQVVMEVEGTAAVREEIGLAMTGGRRDEH